MFKTRYVLKGRPSRKEESDNLKEFSNDMLHPFDFIPGVVVQPDV